MRHAEGVLDTNIVAVLALHNADELPEAVLITAVTLGELSDAPHATDDPIRRARRMAVLQHVEATFDALPYDDEAARMYGQICAAVRAGGRQPRGRVADLMIAAIAASNGLPLYTANPKDFAGLEDMVEIVAVPRPPDATA
ncbi:type II toxin-antitoxin system VapC family toxin [Herbidospora galbida]|uniref:Ribonuclease VapC n=1 Tax=Herbidospora galbida TaxID=2575442 RepID=A0A4U3MDW1_9ACTN|nr:type II toxin-antitoxin system VapC family toxin [Herbidospora galbida]